MDQRTSVGWAAVCALDKVMSLSSFAPTSNGTSGGDPLEQILSYYGDGYGDAFYVNFLHGS